MSLSIHSIVDKDSVSLLLKIQPIHRAKITLLLANLNYPIFKSNLNETGVNCKIWKLQSLET